jgi:LysR family nitrogen assimilation transcriptional regulator
MELKQLESFVHVAELGSFTRAASFLSVVQPVLSRQVRALEVELRQTLLERNGRGVTTTAAGKRLLEHGRGILAQVDRARLALEEERGAATGRLVIALPASVSRTLAGPLVRAFRERFPKATLCILESLSAYALEWLAIARADCVVVYNAIPSPTFELVPVLSERLYLVSSRNHLKARGLIGSDASLAEVARHPLVVPSRPHAIRMLLEAAMAKELLKPIVALEIESIPAILDFVLAEDMHAVLSLNAIRSSGLEESFHVRPLVQPKLAGSLWIATSAQRPSGPLLKQAVQLLHQLVEQHLGLDPEPREFERSEQPCTASCH